MGRKFKITEEQYNRLNEDGLFNSTTSSSGVKNIVQAPRDKAVEAAQEAQNNPKTDGIEFTNTNTNEQIITKKQLVAEARKDWKKGTKVVKLSELLKK